MNKILNRDTEAKQPASAGCHPTTCSLSFSPEMPIREGCYWLRCMEGDDEPEWASIYRRRNGEMMCKLDSLGTYGLKAIHENLTDVQWASALTIILLNVETEARHG